MTLDIAVLVDNITIFINSMSNQPLWIAFNEYADAVAIFIFYPTIFDDAETLVSCEGTLLFDNALVLWNQFASTDDFAGVAVNETLVVTAAASQIFNIALNKATDGNAVLIDNKTLLVEDFVLEDG